MFSTKFLKNKLKSRLFVFLPLAFTSCMQGGNADYSSPISSHQQQVEFENLKYDTQNLSSEQKIISVRLENCEEKLDALMALINDSKGKSSEDLSEKIQQISKDLHLLQTHLNELNQSTQKKFQGVESDLNKLVQTQSDNLQSLKKALVPPQTESKDNLHQVEKGDSLQKIAQKHHTTVEELKRVNHLQNDRIIIGQKLRLP